MICFTIVNYNVLTSLIFSTEKTSPSTYQSPSVKGGEHEECAWFTLEEAVKVSPVFANIFENKIFIDFLQSVKNTKD